MSTAWQWPELQSDAEACSSFCSALHERGFALLQLPESARADVTAVRELAARFFSLPDSAKHEAAAAEADVGGGEGVGYRDKSSHDSEFLELYLTAAGATYPAIDSPAGLGAATAALHRRLSEVARGLLTIIAAERGIPAATLLQPLALWAPDSGGDVGHTPSDSHASADGGGASGAAAAAPDATAPPDAVWAADAAPLSTSLLRVCHYRPAPCAPPPGSPADVLFASHTDSTLLTLSPLTPEAPALQLRRPVASEGWVNVEELAGLTPLHVEVHAGDFLGLLTRGYYSPCTHRVSRPKGGVARVSCPLLLRPRDDWRRGRGWLDQMRDVDSSSSDGSGDEASQRSQCGAAREP